MAATSLRCEGELIKALVAALLKNQRPFLGVSSMAHCVSEALVYLLMDFRLLSLQGLLHSCLVPCYVCKQVTSSVFPKFVFLWVSSLVQTLDQHPQIWERLEIQIFGSTLNSLNLKLVVKTQQSVL